MTTVALLAAYDGTDFRGWQVQPAQRTVQGAIQDALDQVHGVRAGQIAVVGAGRTDAGVHALGQVASYAAPTPRSTAALKAALLGLLPPAVRVLDLRAAPPGFDARRAAIAKIYRYRIVNRPELLPFESRWAWHVRQPLDVEAMRAAAAALVGRFDFAAFANVGGQAASTVRTLRRLALMGQGDGVLTLEFEADGFLYRMVRNLTGLLVDIGRGRRPVEDARAALSAQRRSAAGLAAPPQGLCLVRVQYAPGLAQALGWLGLEAALSPIDIIKCHIHNKTNICTPYV